MAFDHSDERRWKHGHPDQYPTSSWRTVRTSLSTYGEEGFSHTEMVVSSPIYHTKSIPPLEWGACQRTSFHTSQTLVTSKARRASSSFDVVATNNAF